MSTHIGTLSTEIELTVDPAPSPAESSSIGLHDLRIRETCEPHVQLDYGLYPAVVSDSTPDDQGRIEVELPWLGDVSEPIRVRATLMSAWGSADRGLLATPAVDTQVIVGFEAGNLMRPHVVGACWNKVTLASSNGHRLTLDAEGSVIRIEHASGQTITLAADGSIQISVAPPTSTPGVGNPIVEVPT